ncbi:MAG: hypothetical protein WA857_19050 [Candidatus Acidiferrum sp.]
MDVVGHDTPGEEFVTLGVEIPDGISHNLGDAGVEHVAMALSGVETALCFLEDGAQFGNAGAVGGNAGRFSGCVEQRAAFVLELLPDFAGQGVGQAEGYEVDGILAF